MHLPGHGLVRLIGVGTLLLPLCGCFGLTVPDLHATADFHQETLDETGILNHINCELALGYVDAIAAQPVMGISTDWLKSWGAKVTTTFTVDEKGGLSPSATLTPMGPAQITAIGVSGTLSSDAQRKDSFSYTRSFLDLARHAPKNGSCADQSGPYASVDFKLRNFIMAKATLAQVPGVMSAVNGAPYDSLTDEIQFIVTASAGAAPAIKLVGISTNASGSLVSASQANTQDVIITLGPVNQPEPGKPATLKTDAKSAHDAAVQAFLTTN